MSEMNRREFGRSGRGARGPWRRVALTRHDRRRGRGSRLARPRVRYVHLDVFTDRRLQGNQLFVFVQPAGLDTETMQTMTRESNLSECTFVFPPEVAGTDHRVRIFGRTAEMPFAGHPTIGTAFALAHTGVLKPGARERRVRPRRRPDQHRSRVEGREARVRLDDAAQADVRQDDRRQPRAGGGDRRRGAGPARARRRRSTADRTSSSSRCRRARRWTRRSSIARRSTRSSAAAGIQRRGMYIFSTERGAGRCDGVQPVAGHRRDRRSGHRLGGRAGGRVHREIRLRAAGSRRLDRVSAGRAGPPPEPAARPRDDERRRGDRHQGRRRRGRRRRRHDDAMKNWRVGELANW